MFWHVSVLPSVCPRGVPISQNALQHFPECHGADTGGVPCQVQLRGGGVPCQVQPCQVQQRGYFAGGYPAGGYPAGGTLLGGTLPGGTLPGPARGGTLPGAGGYPVGYPAVGGTLLGVPCWGAQVWYPLTPPARSGWGGYPVRTTEGVVTTQRAVCFLRSRRRTFLLLLNFTIRPKQFTTNQ